MDKKEVIQELHDLVHESAAGTGMIGSLRQSPYREMLFKLFTTAYWGGMTERQHDRDSLTGDYLRDEIAKLCATAKDQDGREFKLLWEVTEWWNEWRYAYEHHDQR